MANGQRGAPFVPDAMVVRALDPENIISRPQVADRDLVAVADIDPVIVQALDLVGILVAPRIGIGEGGRRRTIRSESLWPSSSVFMRLRSPEMVQVAVEDLHLGDHHRRHIGIVLDVFREKAGQPVGAAKKQFIVRALEKNRGKNSSPCKPSRAVKLRKTFRCGSKRQSPRLVLSHKLPCRSSSIPRMVLLGSPSSVLKWLNVPLARSKRFKTAAVGADPEAAAAVLQQAVDLVAAQTGRIIVAVAVIAGETAAFRIETAQPAPIGADPYGAAPVLVDGDDHIAANRRCGRQVVAIDMKIRLARSKRFNPSSVPTHSRPERSSKMAQ